MSHPPATSLFDGGPLRPLPLERDSDLDTRVAALWRAARLGPAVEQLRRHVLNGDERRIDGAQFRALEVIADNDPCPMRDLSRALDVNPSTVTRTVNQLAHKGLVTKSRAHHDHREISVSLTADGREAHRYFVDRAFQIYEQVFSVFNDTEKQLLASYLERMLAATDHALVHLRGASEDSP